MQFWVQVSYRRYQSLNRCLQDLPEMADPAQPCMDIAGIGTMNARQRAANAVYFQAFIKVSVRIVSFCNSIESRIQFVISLHQ